MTLIDKAEALALIERKVGKHHPALADELRHGIAALPATDARADALREALNNKEQLDIWAQEILEGLGFSDVLKIESYDDKIEAHSVIGRGIVEVLRSLIPQSGTDALRQAREPWADEAKAFDDAHWFWRTMDPDDCGDSPIEAINRGMVGRFCVCEVASSYSGPTRYGFIAPVLDPESDDEEFVHFATKQEAIDAAKTRAAITEAGQ